MEDTLSSLEQNTEDTLKSLNDMMDEGDLGDDDANAEDEAIKYSSVIRKFVKVDDLTNSDIIFYNNGVNITSILTYLENGTYVFPGFQRRFVWDKSKIAYLALSVIQGVPIPPIYLYIDEDRNQVILDGQQRIISIFLYFNDLEYCRSDHSINFQEVSSLNKKLKQCEDDLEKCKQEIDKKLFRELNREKKKLEKQLYKDHGMRRTSYSIEEHDISFCLFSENNKKYLTGKRLDTTIVESRNLKIVPHRVFANIFKLLNSGGKVLGPQEVRNGIYWKTLLYRRLFSLNGKEGTTWRTIYGKISDFSKDMEILLKVLALNYYTQFNEESQEYEITMQGFSWSIIMDEYSELRAKDANNTEKDILLLEEYLNAIELDNDKGKRLKCQKAVFEAVFVAYSKLEISKDFRIPYNWLCKLKFDKVLSNKASVEERVNTAIKWLEEIYYA